MTVRNIIGNRRPMLLFFIILTALGLPASGVLASKLGAHGRAPLPTSTSSAASSSSAPATGAHAPYTQDAFVTLVPSQVAGNCPAPSNGGTVLVGCRFVLEM